jgi:hypothetical protein
MAKDFKVVNISKLNKQHTITVRVVVTKRMKTRLFIAKQLFKAAALVLGCNVDVIEPDPASVD